jgi:DUF1680 family protein
LNTAYPFTPAKLDTSRRYADYIDSLFGTAPGKRRGYCGHPEIELALLRLYHATGEGHYLDLARYFVNERGQQPHYFDHEAIERGENPIARGHWLGAAIIRPVFHMNPESLVLGAMDSVVGGAWRR